MRDGPIQSLTRSWITLAESAPRRARTAARVTGSSAATRPSMSSTVEDTSWCFSRSCAAANANAAAAATNNPARMIRCNPFTPISLSYASAAGVVGDDASPAASREKRRAHPRACKRFPHPRS